MKKLSFILALLCASMMAWADPIASEYCGTVMSGGNTTAAFTWETNNEGSVIITINEVLGGAIDASHFRGNGISIDKIKVGEEDASTYFNHACGGGQTITLSLKDPSNAPAVGTKIIVDNKVIEYATSKDGNAWPSLTFEYTYGSVLVYTPAPTYMYLSSSSAFTIVDGNITLTPTILDQAFKPIVSVVSYEVSPIAAGNVVGNVYTPSQVGPATITATAGSAAAEITLYCIPGDGTNIALEKSVKAGYEPGNTGEHSEKAVDGNTGTLWVTWESPSSAGEWLYIDLEKKYDLAGIEVVWGGDISNNYILQIRTDAPEEEDEADDDAWDDLATVTDAKSNSIKFTPVEGTGRYVRFHSLSRPGNCIRLAELRIFGTEWVDQSDTEKPVMVSASFVSKTWNKVVIAVSATDNKEIVAYHVVDATNGINTQIVPDMGGNITVSNLTAETEYNFTITAIDGGTNESDNSKSVAATTKAYLPKVAAPTPSKDQSSVMSLYSDSYDFAPASLVGYNQSWWQNPNLTNETIGENHYLHYDLYRDGMIGAQFASISVSEMQKLHLDIYASAAGSVTFRLITNEVPAVTTSKTLELEEGEWNSFDIALTDFGDGHDWATLYQFAIERYYAGGLVGEHISVDNIYLYKETATSIDNTNAEVKAIKVIENGQLVIIKNGVRYNALGAEVR